MKKFRLAKITDAKRMLEIYAPNVLKTAYSFETEVPSLDEFKGRVSETLQKFPWIVCEVDGRIAGYAYVGFHRGRCAYGWSVESTVYVDPDYRSKGIGANLYKMVFELAKEQGAVNVFAGITQPNVASVRLHEAVGFKPIGLFKDIGFKLNQWWDVGWFQLTLQKPEVPQPLKAPLTHFERVL